MKIYISGAITNNQNAAADFARAKQTLKDLNKDYEPISPMDLPHKDNESYSVVFRERISELMKCDGIFMIEGWEDNKISSVEWDLAIELSLKIIYEVK